MPVVQWLTPPGQSLVEDLFGGLFSTWEEIGRPVDVCVETRDEQFEIRLEPTDSEAIEAPPDPPEISRAAEALGADIYRRSRPSASGSYGNRRFP